LDKLGKSLFSREKTPLLLPAIELSISPNFIDALPNDIDIGVCLQVRDSCFIDIGLYRIIAIYKGNILAALCILQPKVASRRQTTIFLVYREDTRILLCIGITDSTTAIGRAIIDQDNAEIGVRLR